MAKNQANQISELQLFLDLKNGVEFTQKHWDKVDHKIEVLQNRSKSAKNENADKLAQVILEVLQTELTDGATCTQLMKYLNANYPNEFDKELSTQSVSSALNLRLMPKKQPELHKVCVVIDGGKSIYKAL